VKPTPGSGPGTTPKPPPGHTPGAPAKPHGIALQQETISPTLVMVEAVRFGCMLCGGVVHAWPSQIGGIVDCPQCKGQTPVPAPLEGGGAEVAVTPVIKPAGKSAQGAAPRPPVAARGAPPRPAPAAAPAAAPRPAPPAAPAKVIAVKPPPAKPFRFPCPHCNSPISADSSHAGLMMLCPKCKQNVAVPEPAPA
jgi:hypothetical protein